MKSPAKSLFDKLPPPINLIAATLFCCSAVPGITGDSTLSAYGWRLSALLLMGAVLLGRRNIYFSLRFVRFYLPYLVLLYFITMLHEGDTLDTLIKNIVVIFFIAIISPTERSDPASKIVFDFIRLSLVILTTSSLILTLGSLTSEWNLSTARLLKAEMLSIVPFNATLFLMAICIPLVRFENIWAKPALWTAFITLSILSATRTPVMALVISWLIAQLGWLIKRRAPRSALPFAAIVITVIFGLMVFLGTSQIPEVNRFLAGRQALWISGLNQWLDAPIIGNRDISVADAVTSIYSDIYFNYDWEVEALTGLRGGGYHNMWIQALATSGLAGFFVTLTGYMLLLFRAFNAETTNYLVVVVMLILRGCLESGGMLFSTGSAPMEVIVNLIAALVLGLPRARKDVTSRPYFAGEAKA